MSKTALFRGVTVTCKHSASLNLPWSIKSSGLHSFRNNPVFLSSQPLHYCQTRFLTRLHPLKVRQSPCLEAKLSPEELEKRRKEMMAKNLPKQKSIDGVKNVVLVSSAKGGVGKSTIAANLAVGIKLEYPNKEIGLLDADVFGPSLPIMMNLTGAPDLDSRNLMVPLQNHGIKCMSMGFLVKDSAPVIWRGLMVMSAIEKLVRGVSWAPLDILIVDMPPGTGDTQLSFAQTVVVNGAVIVTTPQKVAVQDAIKGAEMFRKTNVPLLGCVLNMSSFICPSCGVKSQIARNYNSLLETCKIDLLAEIPFQHEIGVAADEGTPIVLAKPDSMHAKEFRRLGTIVVSKLEASLNSVSSTN